MPRNRKHIRLRNHDYRFGIYFVTICCRDRMPFFGDIMAGAMHLNAIGEYATQSWLEIPAYIPHVSLDEFVIMPNHMHGILHLRYADEDHRDPYVGTRHVVSLHMDRGVYPRPNHFGPLPPGSLAVIIGQFKAAVTRWARKNDHPDFGWQRKFHDRLVRDGDELMRIRQYIVNNPQNWDSDDLNG